MLGQAKQFAFGSKLKVEIQKLQRTLLIFLASGLGGLLSLRPLITDLIHGKSILLFKSQHSIDARFYTAEKSMDWSQTAMV